MIPVLWLASYPRSGNTMMRIILAQCFGLPTAANYADQLGGNPALHRLVRRIAPSADGVIEFGDVPIRVVKTHSRPQDRSKAIYIIRNGIDAVASWHDHCNRSIPIATLIAGRPGLPTWRQHVEWWQPATRPDTLFLRYEGVVADVAATVAQVADFIGVRPCRDQIPSRDELATVDGRWIRSASAPGRTRLSPAEVEQFWQVNGIAMQEHGYARNC